jgi:hypothetical protein
LQASEALQAHSISIFFRRPVTPDLDGPKLSLPLLTRLAAIYRNNRTQYSLQRIMNAGTVEMGGLAVSAKMIE